MHVGEVITNSYTLTPARINGRSALKVGDKEGYLVKLDEEARDWAFVDTIDQEVSLEDLKGSYGIWKDEEIKKGILFLRKVVRPRDGLIQNDEVRELMKEYPQKKDILEKKEDPPFYGDKVALFPPRKYYSIKPDARITLKTSPQGVIAVLEEKWECTEEGYKCFV